MSKQIDRLLLEKKIHGLSCSLSYEDDSGRQIIIPAQKFVRGFISLLCVKMLSETLDIKRDDDTTASVSTNQVNLKCGLTTADDTMGIIIGVGTTSVSITDTKLGSKEPHLGSATSYGATSVSAPSTAGSTRSFTIARTFTNNRVGPPPTNNFIVKEVGLLLHGLSGSPNILADRTVLPSDVTIPSDGGTKTFTYTISITV